MNKKTIVYSFLPVLVLAGFLGARAVSAHGMGMFGGFGFGGFTSQTPDQIATRQQAMFQNEATLLGISVDDVKNAWVSGKSISQLMQDKGITQAQVDAKMKDQHQQQLKTQLQALVDKGVITQAQADQRLKTVQSMVQNNTGRGEMGMGMMGMGHHGGFR